MAKLKELDLQSVGGRIRKARIDAAMTTKDLSDKIDVTSAYLLMLERGERNPSITTLGRIAEATKTPLIWLRTGDTDGVGSNPSESPQAHSSYTGKIDAALFLSIIMSEDPSVSKEALATILDVDQNTLKKILNRTLKYNSKLKPAYTTLALRCDIRSLLNRMQEISSFFEDVYAENAEDETDSELIEAIKSALFENIHDDFVYSGQYYSEEGSEDIEKSELREINRGTGYPVKQFIFKQKSTSTRWNTELYSELYEPMVEQLVLTAKNPEDISRISENEALVFMEEENYRMALSCIQEDIDKSGSDSLPKVALMLLDLDAMRITEFRLI